MQPSIHQSIKLDFIYIQIFTSFTDLTYPYEAVYPAQTIFIRLNMSVKCRQRGNYVCVLGLRGMDIRASFPFSHEIGSLPALHCLHLEYQIVINENSALTMWRWMLHSVMREILCGRSRITLRRLSVQ